MQRMILFLFLATLLRAEDPAALKRDGKDAAAIQALLTHQRIDAAKQQAILAAFVLRHDCASGRAGLTEYAQLACIAPGPGARGQGPGASTDTKPAPAAPPPPKVDPPPPAPVDPDETN